MVGPMGTGGLSLPGVDKVMQEMEGGSVEDMKEKFARLGRRVSFPPPDLYWFCLGLLGNRGRGADLIGNDEKYDWTFIS